MPDVVFALEIEDGWPPVAAECLPCSNDEEGLLIEAAPLFIKGVSVGDVIQVICEESGQVMDWSHISKSDHSTIWLMAFGNFSLDEPMTKLRANGCHTNNLSAYGIASVDVPASTSAAAVDEVLGSYSKDQLAIAYPSWRHD